MSRDIPRRSAGVQTNVGVPKSLRPIVEKQLDAATDLDAGFNLVHSKTYDVVQLLGEGGMGKIYKAFDAGMDRYVALKLLKLDVSDEWRRRFRREAVIAANFSHPNLVRVLDVGGGEGERLEWMTMEYLRGRDLGEIIDRSRHVSAPLVVDMFRQTLDAMHYIHQRQIAHCDIKPDNIFVTRDVYDRRIVIVKLIDFGIARKLDGPIELQTNLAGDPRYMSPEQAVLNGPLDQRSDVYSLGMTLYEVLTGRHPFQFCVEGSVHDMLDAHRESDFEPPSKFMRDIPAGLAAGFDSVVARACAKKPDDRYQTALEMRAALTALLDQDAG